MSCSLADLGFVDWPFTIVPDDFNTTFSCDRAWLVERTNELLDSYTLRGSTITNLVWSDVGAGKTHTLKNLAYKAQKRGFTSCYYFEMPEKASSFIDLHNAFIFTVGLDTILDAFPDNQREFAKAPILNQIAQTCYTGHNTEQAARAWVNGTAGTAERRLIGLPRELTIQQCIQNFAVLANALSRGPLPRTIVMVDEFQRVAERSSASSKAVQSGVSSLINAAPTGLGLILAFQAPPDKQLPGWVDVGLASRVSMSHFIPIMVLSRKEAAEFLKEIIRCYSSDGKKGIFPFTPPVITHLVDVSGGERVLPRDLLARASSALEHYFRLDGAGKRELTVEDLKNAI